MVNVDKFSSSKAPCAGVRPGKFCHLTYFHRQVVMVLQLRSGCVG